jgi:hypothetical protein
MPFRRTAALAALLFAVAGAADAQTVVPLDSRQAFLHIDSADAAQPAPALSLAAMGLAPGQLLRLEPLGDFDNGPGGDEFSPLLVVFSSSATLLGPALQNRVPDAVDAGLVAVTGPSQPSYEPTDIPYDFYAAVPGRVVAIPAGATHIFIAPAEVYYVDNSDPDGDFAVRLTGLGAAAAPDAAAPARLSAAPNPFNPTTTIAFALAAAGPARLDIIDAAGRRVRTLADEERSAGSHRVTWDGRDDAGRGVASGSYFARLETAGMTTVTGLSLVR